MQDRRPASLKAIHWSHQVGRPARIFSTRQFSKHRMRAWRPCRHQPGLCLRPRNVRPRPPAGGTIGPESRPIRNLSEKRRTIARCLL
ncbi:hypothetical protein CENSYa_0279 [Cenarchaeum symbiosum A]|uniref:Uncharacterized protein n=1 Tax=Cenarchaeum symbiosum (strain A) TaxID=414004 RepID=A0RUA2_CENSY|nr:hypothetical protein CENSYa_0279 [Cenarchaeum symbiosum A]